MAIAKQARKKTISATSAEGARVMEALAQASKETKRIADANKLPFIAGRKQSWSVPHGTTLSDFRASRIAARA
jgi:cell envelope opacity-associated protein A